MELQLAPKYDVVIAGGGPAGASLAIRLSEAGLSVLVVEKRRFPREKLCGEFISPECLTHFRHLGVSTQMLSAGGTELCETIFYARNGRSVGVPSQWFGAQDKFALGLSRAEMDNILLERASAVGATICVEAAATGLTFENGEVIGIKIKDKHGHESDISAPLVVDATGRSQSLVRHVPASKASSSKATHVAFKTHLLGAATEPGICEIYAYRGGYGGCNSVEGGLHNLCFIAPAKDTRRLSSDPERVMREIVFTNSRAAQAMKNAVAAKPWVAVPIQKFGRGSLTPSPGLVSVGDAAAFIDPFTGSGMLMALESAAILANAVVESRAERDRDAVALKYRAGYSAAFDRRLRVCSILRHSAFVPFLADVTISLLSLNSRFRKRVARATRFNAGPAA